MALEPHDMVSNEIRNRNAPKESAGPDSNAEDKASISNASAHYPNWLGGSLHANSNGNFIHQHTNDNADGLSEVRLRFRKSHTCGSLFAKCNCGNPSLTITPPPPNAAQNETSRILSGSAGSLRDLSTSNGIQRQARPPTPHAATQYNRSPQLPAYRRRLFQSFSHPDTDFIFTDENKRPLKSDISDNLRKRLSKSPADGACLKLEQDIATKSHNHVLDVYGLDGVPTGGQELSAASISNQRGNSAQNLISKSREGCNMVETQSNSSKAQGKINDNFDDAAQKFFAESGILGPMQGNDMVRKTSRVLQDPHVIEQIRKTSLVLRTMNHSPLKRASTVSQCSLLPPYNTESEFYGGLISKPRPVNINRECELLKTLQREITTLKNVIATKDSEIEKLGREIHKLKSVLEQTHCLAIVSEASVPEGVSKQSTPVKTAKAAFTTQHESKGVEGQAAVASASASVAASVAERHWNHGRMLKKQGVSAESCEWQSSQLSDDATAIPKYHKDFASKQLIKDAIMDNDFLKHIDATQVREIVDSMWHQHIPKGEFLITEGDVGAHLYVSADGEFEVLQHGVAIGVIGAGKAFGELAILYNCTRTASIRVLSENAHVWVLDRRIYQKIMKRTGLQRIENSVNFLKSVPLLQNLNEELLMKIADVLEVEFYEAGTYIIRQGATGDTFFIISQGTVKVTQKQMPTQTESVLRELGRGDYFGEQALINEDKRTANIIAQAPGVECLTLDRDSFLHLIGDLCELKQKSYDNDDDENNCHLAKKNAEMCREIFASKIKQEFSNMRLDDLELITTLGVGGFGRVELVKAYCRNETNLYALKCLKKQHIVETKQQEHVFSERTIMLACDSPFICRLYRTFRDSKYVYMLLEACMGGEIWTMLRDRGAFEESAAQFIVGCVLQAFDYLHSRGIIYRDLKPENLMLDQRGYVKLVDFGFAKYIGISNKTWTFCGTPEYVAPEIILNKGHDRAVDYWALGILVHELLNGAPPFTSNDPMKTYNQILKGIEMIAFPKTMSRSAVQLIKKLCRYVPAERLGYQKAGMQDIKKHKWFLGFDWDGLESQTLNTPFVRPLAHAADTSYFDQFFADVAEPPDENSGWDLEF